MKNTIIFILIFFSASLSAQKITWKSTAKDLSHCFIKINEHACIDAATSAKLATRKLILTKYDLKTLKKQNEVKHPLDRFGYFYKVLDMKDHSYVLTAHKDKKIMELLFEEIDYTKLELMDIEPLFRINPGKIHNAWIQGHFHTAVSEDKTKLVVGGLKTDKSGASIFKIVVYNQNLEKIWKRNLRVNPEYKYYGIGEIAITNEGSVYFPTFEMKKKLGMDDRKIYTSIKINSLTDDGEVYHKFSANGKKIDLQDNIMLWSPRPGIISLFTLYRKNIKTANPFYDGYFYEEFATDENTSSIGKKLIDFPKDLPFQQLEGQIKATKKVKARIKKGGGLVEGIDIKFVHYDTLTENTTIALERRSKSKNAYLPPARRSIILLQLNKEGELNWHNSINKNQTRNFDSYIFKEHNGDFYVIFNDVKKNVEKRKKKTKVAVHDGKLQPKNGTISCRIDKNGKMYPEKIFPFDKNFQIYPELYEVDKETLLLFGQMSRKIKMGKLTF